MRAYLGTAVPNSIRVRVMARVSIRIRVIGLGLGLGMLNDYRIFDYRIKCSFSFSFVSHSILGFTLALR